MRRPVGRGVRDIRVTRVVRRDSLILDVALLVGGYGGPGAFRWDHDRPFRLYGSGFTVQASRRLVSHAPKSTTAVPAIWMGNTISERTTTPSIMATAGTK